MKLSKADQKTYPNFAQYVRYQFPKLRLVPKILKGLDKYGHLSKREANQALSWGTLPLIVITHLHKGQCGVPKAYGCFRHAKPTRIEIHTGDVKNFESALSGNTDKNKKGKAVYVAGVTLLHELCHWGNYNNVPRIPEKKEMGEAFELHVYGKIIG